MRITIYNSEHCGIYGGNQRWCDFFHNGGAGLCNCYPDGGGF